jgi:hypothetical protein
MTSEELGDEMDKPYPMQAPADFSGAISLLAAPGVFTVSGDACLAIKRFDVDADDEEIVLIASSSGVV